MMTRQGKLWIVALLLLVSAAPVGATTVLGFSLSAIIARADTIALVAVVRTEVLADGMGRAFTRSTVQVYQGLKGASRGDTFHVDLPGGRLPGGAACL